MKYLSNSEPHWITCWYTRHDDEWSALCCHVHSTKS